MIKIRDESDFKSWFSENYKKLGFLKIVRKDISRFPDFIMLDKNGERVKVELEIKSSNFLLHKHNPKKADRVICIKKDCNLKIPITELKNIKIVESNEYREPSYSLKNKILALLKKERVLTSSDVSKLLGVSWNTAEISLLNLVVDGKIEKIKREGVNLWLEK